MIFLLGEAKIKFVSNSTSNYSELRYLCTVLRSQNSHSSLLIFAMLNNVLVEIVNRARRERELRLENEISSCNIYATGVNQKYIHLANRVLS